MRYPPMTDFKFNQLTWLFHKRIASPDWLNTLLQILWPLLIGLVFGALLQVLFIRFFYCLFAFFFQKFSVLSRNMI